MNVVNGDQVEVAKIMARLRDSVLAARSKSEDTSPSAAEQTMPATLGPSETEGPLSEADSVQQSSSQGTDETPRQFSRVDLPRAAPLKASTTYKIEELLVFRDAAFVEAAYFAVFNRQPDPEGLRFFLAALREGLLSRVEVLGRLRYSPEGRKAGVRIRGLLPKFLAKRVTRLPVIGPIIGVSAWATRLPQIVRTVESIDAQLHFRDEQLAAVLNDSTSAVGAEIQSIRSQMQAVIEAVSKSSSDNLGALNRRVEDVSVILAHKATVSALDALSAELKAVVAGKADSAYVEAVVAELRRVAATKADANLVAAELRTEVEAADFDQRISEIVGSMVKKADATALNALTDETRAAMSSKAEASILSSLREEMSAVIAAKDALAQELRAVLSTKADSSALAATTDELRNAVASKAEAGILDTALRTKADAAVLDQRVAEIVALTHQKADLPALDGLAAELRAASATKAEKVYVDAASDALRQEFKQIGRQVVDYRRNLLDQQRRLALLLEEARKRLPEPMSTAQIETLVSEEDHLLDAFYVSFEDQFRGSREDIKERVRVYLPRLAEAGLGGPEAPIMDVGCGRGEWLELLRDAGLQASGIDANRVMISQCKELGLNASEGDALKALRSLKPASLGALTGFHIIEHLQFKQVVALFDEALRVVKPSGLVIFETPNPENIFVGACNFYYDPTHRNPLPPEAIRFLAEARGFVGVEILRLHPMDAPIGVPASQFEWPVSAFLAAQDYAIIARRP